MGGRPGLKGPCGASGILNAFSCPFLRFFLAARRFCAFGRSPANPRLAGRGWWSVRLAVNDGAIIPGRRG